MVEPVSNVAPQLTQVTVHLWYSGWMSFFMSFTPFAL
jgi:hypothetical protein